jgi:hypothetical protein
MSVGDCFQCVSGAADVAGCVQDCVDQMVDGSTDLIGGKFVE